MSVCQAHASSAELVSNLLRSAGALLAALQSRMSTSGSSSSSDAAAAAAAAEFSGCVLQQLNGLGGSDSSSSSSSSGLAWRMAIVAAAPSAAAVGLACGSLSPAQLAAAAGQAQALAATGADGRLCGAAAVSWTLLVCMRGCAGQAAEQVRWCSIALVLASSCMQSCNAPLTQPRACAAAVGTHPAALQELHELVVWLAANTGAAGATAAPAAAAKLPGAAALPAGAAAGLALLLGVDVSAGS